MSTLESLQSEIDQLKKDVLTLSEKFISQKELDNLKSQMISPSQFNKLNIAVMGMVSTLGYSISSSGAIITSINSVTASTLAGLSATIANLTRVLAPLIKAGTVAMGALAQFAVLLAQIAGAAMAIFGTLEVIKRIDQEFKNIIFEMNYIYKTLSGQIVATKKEAAAIRSEAEAAIAQLEMDKANKDDMKKQIAAAIATTEKKMKAGDQSVLTIVYQVQGQLKKEDIIIKKQVNAVNDRTEKITIAFNGFSTKVIDWMTAANQSIDKWSEMIKKANITAENAIISINETKGKLSRLEGEIITTTKGLEAANKKHDSLIFNFTKLKELLNQWTIETNKGLTYAARNIYELQQELRKIKNMAMDTTPIMSKLDKMDKNMIAMGAGLTLGMTGVSGQIQGLTGTMNNGFNGVKQQISTTTTAINNNMNNLKDKMKKLGGMFDFSFILQLISTAATLHNAAMLSQNVLQSFMMVFDNLFALFGVKDSEGNALNISAVIGKSINDILTSALGASTVKDLSARWNAFSRIYQASMNVIYSVTSMIDSTRNIVEIVGSYTGRIGNALKSAGVVWENAYSWMHTDLNAMTATSQRWQNFYQSVENIETVAGSLNTVTGEMVSIKDNVEQLKVNREELNKAVAETEKLIEQKESASKGVSTAPKDLDNANIGRPTEEE